MTPAHALNIEHLRFGVHPDKIRLVLDLSEISDFRVFILSSPYRMVIDLPSFTWEAGQSQRNEYPGILAVRHGNLSPGISRIVLDMDKPAAVHNAFVLRGTKEKSDRLVIDFSFISIQAFKSEKGKVHGTLLAKPAATLTKSATGALTRTASAYTHVQPPVPRLKFRKPLIVIDPGHGGVDPGAVSKNNIYEKTVVLALAKTLKKELENTGRYRVLLTRDRDIFIKLSDRVKFARKHEADLFLSLHADSLEKSNVRGASVYTLSEKASDKQTAKLAARENKADLIAGIDLSIEDEDVANILMDLAMRDTMNQSKFFAEKLVNTFDGEQMRILERPHRYAGFAVLKAPDVPSILLEAGFMSNLKEARQLNTPSYRKKLSHALRKGIDAYFEQVYKNQRI